MIYFYNIIMFLCLPNMSYYSLEYDQTFYKYTLSVYRGADGYGMPLEIEFALAALHEATLFELLLAQISVPIHGTGKLFL